MSIYANHRKLETLMRMIEHANIMVAYTASWWPDRSSRYTRVRSRLYQAYASQLARMCQKAIAHERS